MGSSRIHKEKGTFPVTQESRSHEWERPAGLKYIRSDGTSLWERLQFRGSSDNYTSKLFSHREHKALSF